MLREPCGFRVREGPWAGGEGRGDADRSELGVPSTEWEVKTDLSLRCQPHSLASGVRRPAFATRVAICTAHDAGGRHETGVSLSLQPKLMRFVVSGGVLGEVTACSCFRPIRRRRPSFYQGLLGPSLPSVLRGGIAYRWDLRREAPRPEIQWMLPLEPFSPLELLPPSTQGA
jgi:hypothetical protein